MRQRNVGKIARRLADAHRAAHASMQAPAGGRAVSPRLLGYVAGLVVLAAAGLGGRYYWLNRAPPAPAGSAREHEDTRLASHCDTMRKDIYTRSSIVAGVDAGGWVVELWLARRSGEDLLPALAGVEAGGKLAPDVDAVLGQVSDGTLKLVDGEVAGPGSDAAVPSWRGVQLLFGGGYAHEYLDPKKHRHFVDVANSLAARTKADMGALYCRCAHLSAHDMGTWFRGRDAGGAAAALVFSMGMFHERPAVDTAKLGAAGDLDSLYAAAKPHGATLASLGGAVSSAGGSVTLTFPILSPSRAHHASQEMADKMGVGITKK